MGADKFDVNNTPVPAGGKLFSCSSLLSFAGISYRL